MSERALPRAFLVGDYEVRDDKQEIINRLLSDDFHPENQVTLEGKINEKISSGSGQVEISKYTPNNVEIEVNHDQPQLLILSDNYYPGWAAKVDGQKTKIYRVDYTFRAVFVPDGRHLVEFVYDPAFFKTGLVLSGGAILILAALNAAALLKRRNRQ